jgi:gliding motility-associated-like protein
MSNKLNIDELLKQELGNLSPEPPSEVWQNVNSQVQATAQAAQASGQAMNGGLSAAKTITLGSKIILATATLAATAGVFFGYRLLTKPETKTEHTVAAVQPVQTETVVETGNEPTDKEASFISPQQQINSSPITTEPASAPRKSEKQVVQKRNQNTATAQPVNTFKESAQNYNSHSVQGNSPQNTVTASKTEQVNTNTPEQSRRLQDETTDNQSKEITEEFAEPGIPNVFTPNNDGANDEFVITIENETLFDLKITDAKGNIVFESTDKNKHWNGTNMFTGKSCEAGTYVLAFRYQVKGMKSPRFKTGIIKLLQ